MNYYIALQTKSQAFLLDQRMKAAGVRCEITYMPRDIMHDICNMGIRVDEDNLEGAAEVLRRSAIPGYRIFREIVYSNRCSYIEIEI